MANHSEGNIASPNDLPNGGLGSYEDKNRSTSVLNFEDVQAALTAKSMRNELNRLVEHVSEPKEKAHLAREMDAFFHLFSRYLAEKNRGRKLDWEKVNSPDMSQIIDYGKLPKPSDAVLRGDLAKLAVLKLNGGLGTTMGCVGPKSVIEVRDGMTFLDLTVRQIEYLNATHSVNVPLILMNSFNTDDETGRIIQRYGSHKIQIRTFNQSRYPRVMKESLVPMPRTPRCNSGSWYPPGHGDLFESLVQSGLLAELLADGKEWLFVSNVDNLGATVDPAILHHCIAAQEEFVMEVTEKTRADIKGGTLIDYEGSVRLLEIAQVPTEHVDDFKSIKKFKIFNTNNLWINLRAVQRVMERDELSLEIIVNQKTLDGGEKVIQLETAVGAAIKHFSKSHGINVPRSRFLPVKSTSDLFLVTSDLYSLHHGVLTTNPKRMFSNVPLVKLGDHFKKVQHFLSRFASPPHILELDHLTVTGDVTFGPDVTLKGTVIIVANAGNRIDIAAGAVLDNKVVSGNLRILDH